MTQRRWTRKLWLALGGTGLALLAAAVFTLGSLNAPVLPERSNTFVVLFALSTFIVVAFLVFGLVLTRSLLRLWTERRAGHLGARFKTKMVLGAMGVSLLPVIFLFFISYALLNRTLNLWFPRPLEKANALSRQLLNEMVKNEQTRLRRIASQAAIEGQPTEAQFNPGKTLSRALGEKADDAWIALPDGRIFTAPQTSLERNSPESRTTTSEAFSTPHEIRQLPNGAELWTHDGNIFLAVGEPLQGQKGTLFAARRMPPDFLNRYEEIETQRLIYEQRWEQLRAYKTEILLALLLITLLVIFATTWFALFLSKQVTVPIESLAAATQEIARGNFDHRVNVQADDELGTLMASFNEMTAQLGENRRKIDEFTRSLQAAVEERERRRKLMETILENVPTGVLSLDSNGTITRINSAVAAIFGEHARSARTLAELFGEEAARDALQLMRQSLRMGVASKELRSSVPGRVLHAAVTVSSLGPRRSNPGYVVVIDDLTELLRAQRAAAWQEVAQRIAHEIKNPLTPIQLSAQRLLRHLERADGRHARGPRSELEFLVAECAGLIEREVETLASLVNEFSQFARFPAARLASGDLNAIASDALRVFHGRLEGISLRTEFCASLPTVKADRELLRRVVVNLIDNAAEAMEGSTVRQLFVCTRLDREGDAVELEVADSGYGISPEDKDRLFLPHFSTKGRGTGLGLAIARRIVEEHHGTLRVEDNIPTGARFIIRIPTADVPTAQTSVSL